jgi:hypothetical protein
MSAYTCAQCFGFALSLNSAGVCSYCVTRTIREFALPAGAKAGATDGCGTQIPRYVTEADVRRIVREELALREGSNPKGECPPGPSAEHEEPGREAARPKESGE